MWSMVLQSMINRLSREHSLPGEIIKILRSASRDILNPYRPERHYMRGPGPKWRAAHQH